MKLSLNLIKQYVDLPEEMLLSELIDFITLHIAEVDGYEDKAAMFEHIVVGKVLNLAEHPNADKLKIVVVDIGSKQVQLVCGGSNLYQGQLVVVALPGAKVRWHGEGDLIVLEEAKIRGENSFGMICAGEEVGLAKSQEGEIVDLTSLNVESKVGVNLSEVLGYNDVIIEIDNKAITHRPDLWSHYGMARDLAACLDLPLKPYVLLFEDFEKDAVGSEEVSLTVGDEGIISAWRSVVLNNIKIGPSPDWLREILESLGMRSVNNIVDVTNLVMLEYGQPLHAYDKAKLGSLDLEIRFAREGEVLKTLDHKERKLNSSDPVLVRRDEGEPLIVLGVMGGENSEIDEQTTSIVLESATFDGVVIRKSSTSHNLRSDASQRFEKSLDTNMCEVALKKAVGLIIDVCGGELAIGGLITRYDWNRTESAVVKLNPLRVSQYLGVEMSVEVMIDYLQRLGCEIKDTGGFLEVTVPTYRSTRDLLTEVDLIEEIIRVYGYEKIEADLPDLPVRSPIFNLTRLKEHQARDILRGLGLSEVVNYSFYALKDLEKSQLKEKNHLKLKNYLSEEQTHMRSTLVVNLLKVAEFNLKYFDEVKIFEIGRTFEKGEGFFPLEEEKLGVIMTGDFYEFKGVLEQFLASFSLEKFDFVVAKEVPEYWHKRKSLQIVDEKGVEVGVAGVLSPLVTDSNICYAELNLARLEHSHVKVKEFQPISKFPTIEFDLSVVVDKSIYSAEIVQVIRGVSELIVEVDFVDCYEGENLPMGKKALTYTIKLQSSERTLTDLDLAEVQKTAVKKLRNALQAEIRGFE